MSVLREGLFSSTNATEVSIRTRQKPSFSVISMAGKGCCSQDTITPSFHDAICASRLLEKVMLDRINLLLSTTLQETKCSPNVDVETGTVFHFLYVHGYFA